MSDEEKKFYLLQLIYLDDDDKNCSDDYGAPMFYKTYEEVIIDIKKVLIQEINEREIYDIYEQKDEYNEIMDEINKCPESYELYKIRSKVLTGEYISFVFDWTIYTCDMSILDDILEK